MSLNKVMLIGNVGQDPSVRYLDSNSQGGPAPKVATFTLATTERFRDRSGNLQENTEWHNIVAWRALADTAEKFIRKGSQIYVEGRLRTRSWTDQGGNKRYTTEVLADNIQLLGRRQEREEGPAPYQAPAPQAGNREAPAGFQPKSAPTVDLPEPDGVSDDLPF